MRDAIAFAGLLLASLQSSCGGDSSTYARAAITTGLAVAAAGANRAVTGSCWADCPPGTACDGPSGTCVPLPCRNACPADRRCVKVDGKETCVLAQERDTAGSGPAPAATGSGAPGPAPAGEGSATDACHGLCFRDEHCMVRGGVAECVTR